MKVIVFLRDFSVFISQHDLGRGYCVTDRVTSSRCPGEELNRRSLKFWDLAVVKLKEKPAHTADVDIVYAAELLAVKLDRSFLLPYDIGGQGLELPSWVRPCAQMLWHLKDVLLVLHLGVIPVVLLCSKGCLLGESTFSSFFGLCVHSL